MSKKITQRLITVLNKKKVKGNFIATRMDLAKYLGESHQTIYNRLELNNWSYSDSYALKGLFEFNQVSGLMLTGLVEDYLKKQKIEKRKLIMTRMDVAKYLGISISLLYQRMGKHNWTEEEIYKINKL